MQYIKNILFVITLSLFLKGGFAQINNLVPNPGFEDYSICPYLFPDNIDLAKPWTQPKAVSTSDFYHKCSSSNGTQQAMSVCSLPRKGLGCTGIGFFNFPDDVWREYIEIKMLKTLEKDKKYCAGFYLKRLGYYAIDAIGIFFSGNFVVQTTDTIIPNIIPQVSNPTGNIIFDKTKWSKIKGIFVANGDEQYMTIGNFVKSQFVNGVLDSGFTYSNSYYFIDDVSVCDCEDFKPRLGRDTTLCTGQQLLLKANIPKEADSVIYSWQDGSKDSMFLVSQPGTYWVSAYIEDYKITVMDSILVNYTDCTPPKYPLWIPNSFTPNGDGLNDIFKPETLAEIEDYTMLIFNRWGQLIFESKDINKGWDGKYKGKQVESGVYTYRIEAKDRATYEKKLYIGRVTLVY
jgi:gliding motility-associated-like protein